MMRGSAKEMFQTADISGLKDISSIDVKNLRYTDVKVQSSNFFSSKSRILSILFRNYLTKVWFA